MNGVVQFLRVLTACLIVAVGTVLALRAGIFDPDPFTDATVIDVQRNASNQLHVEIKYVKTDAACSYIRGQAFAELPGGREPVNFRPIRVGGQDDQRFPGQQTLRWNIDLNGWYPEIVSIWTRHECVGQPRPIDTLMAEILVPEISE